MSVTISGSGEITGVSGVKNVPASDVSYDGGTVQDVLDTVTGANGAGSIGYTPAGAGAVATSVQSKLRESVSVFDFMTSAQISDVQAGTASVDVTAAIQAAINTGKKTIFPRGTYKITAGLEIDVYTQCIEGDGAVIDATSVTGFAVRVVSTAPSLQTRALQNFNKVAISGVSFLGTNSTGRFGIVIGRTGASYGNSNDIVVERSGFYGFEKQVAFEDNAWRTKFVNCGFEGGAYPIYFQAPANAGEVMEFDHCWIVDWTVGPVIVNGNFLFNGCSLIGGAATQITLDGNAHVDFVSCNLEDQADSSNYWLALNGVAHARFLGGQLLVNSTRTKPLVYMTSGAMLTLHGTSLPLYGANLEYEVNAVAGSVIRSIVEGIGKHVTAHGCNTISGVLADFTVQAVLGGSSSIYNGGGETGNTNGWSFTSYGPAGSTITASGSYAKNGSYGLLLTAVATAGCFAWQEIDIGGMAGRAYCAGIWMRAVSGTGTIAFPSVAFYDQAGNQISNTAIDGLTGTETTYLWRAINGYIPDGAVKARVFLDAQQLAGGCSVAYDDVIFQVL